MIELDLTKAEKRRLRKALIARIVLFFLAILPIMLFTCYMLYLAVMSFFEGSQDMFSYIVPIVIVLFYLAAGKYILPQYRNMFKYGTARSKQIIETTVLDVRCSYIRGIPFFYITTDSGVSVNTKSNVIFYMDVPAIEIVKGMKLYLHIIPGLKNEILRVSTGAGSCKEKSQKI